LEQLSGIERDLFVQFLGAAFHQARTDQSHLGLLLVDLTNLARINHYHGYQAGDRILLTAQQQLLGISKLPNTVFRVGSHRFGFILPDLGNPAYVALALNRAHRVLESELHGDSGLLGVDIKIGIAINRESSRDAMAMLAAAEASLAQVKLGGVQRIEDVLGADGEEPADFRLEQRFAAALQDNAFDLHFQPKVDLRTGQVCSAEALLRWKTEGEYIAPELVVQLAESAGQTYELTKWVVHRALRQVKDWQGSLDVGLAINVPASLAGDPDLPALLNDAIAIWGVPAARITVELTESAVIEDKQSGFDNLLEIRNQGINISIDDFGTGYSSLSYFKQIPAAELKIDKSFVDSMLVDSQDLELVKVIIYIAHKFGLTVVAEGVEDRASLNVLRELGCDTGQGYFFSKPLPRGEFECWLRDWQGLAE
jgi:diguanylate cyclase (GGDEF)-like protein